MSAQPPAADGARAPPSAAQPLGTEILRIEGLRIEARTDEDSPAKLIVEDVDLVLHRGEVLGLIGESGAGKSTIGLAALGYTRPGCTITGGRILFDGVDLRI
jgi:ATPase components of various ABC-type transport systems, contain duplicated ATPase